MARDSFQEIDAYLEALPALVKTAAEDGLIAAAPALQAHAQATDLYENRTGATRGSTVSYFAGGATADAAIAEAIAVGQTLIELARRQAEQEGHVGPQGEAVVTEVEPEGGPGASTVVVTAMMSYDEFLFTMQAGARDALTAALYAEAGDLLENAAYTAGRVFEG